MRIRFFPVCICAALLLPGPVPANELLRIYDLAVQNDTQLRAAEQARAAAREAPGQSGGALLPQLSGVGSASTQRDTLTPAAGTGAGITTRSSSEPYNASLVLSQVLFNKDLWNRWRKGGDLAAAGEASYRSAQQNLVLRVTEAYFNVLAAADNLRFANAENQAVERQLELAKKRFEVGLSAITDVQEAQARYDLTVALMIEAEQALASAREALAEITGPAEVRIQPLQDEIPLQGPNPENVNEWLKIAAESSLDILAAQIQADLARRDVRINAAGHYPTLSLVGEQTVGESSGFTAGEYEQSQLSLELSVPLFAGGTTQANVRAARSVHEQRLAELEGVRRQVERRTRDAYQGIIAGVSRVAARRQAVVSLSTALEAAEVGLEVGTRTGVDVLDAQRELYSAQRDHARARYDYLLNVLRLKNAVGQLESRDLDEIDRLLQNTSGPAAPG
ncbi:MAG: TolC family outer membrane protein [Nevskiales bacterium]|nr:TolC family outer membrane protein [Nevskiales bacterium]